jgi:hypothetical protein
LVAGVEQTVAAIFHIATLGKRPDETCGGAAPIADIQAWHRQTEGKDKG